MTAKVDAGVYLMCIFLFHWILSLRVVGAFPLLTSSRPSQKAIRLCRHSRVNDHIMQIKFRDLLNLIVGSTIISYLISLLTEDVTNFLEKCIPSVLWRIVFVVGTIVFVILLYYLIEVCDQRKRNRRHTEKQKAICACGCACNNIGPLPDSNGTTPLPDSNGTALQPLQDSNSRALQPLQDSNSRAPPSLQNSNGVAPPPLQDSNGTGPPPRPVHLESTVATAPADIQDLHPQGTLATNPEEEQERLHPEETEALVPREDTQHSALQENSTSNSTGPLPDSNGTTPLPDSNGTALQPLQDSNSRALQPLQDSNSRAPPSLQNSNGVATPPLQDSNGTGPPTRPVHLESTVATAPEDIQDLHPQGTLATNPEKEQERLYPEETEALVPREDTQHSALQENSTSEGTSARSRDPDLVIEDMFHCLITEKRGQEFCDPRDFVAITIPDDNCQPATVEAALGFSVTLPVGSKVVYKWFEVGPQTTNDQLHTLKLQVMESVREAQEIDKDFTLQLGSFAVLKYTDHGPKWWRLQEHWIPTISNIQRCPWNLLDLLTGRSATWIIRGFNLQNAQLKFSNVDEKEVLNILRSYKMESGEDVLLCEEPYDLVHNSALLFRKETYICALRSVEVEEGVIVNLQSNPHRVHNKTYWVSVVQGLIPSQWALLILASLSLHNIVTGGINLQGTSIFAHILGKALYKFLIYVFSYFILVFVLTFWRLTYGQVQRAVTRLILVIRSPRILRNTDISLDLLECDQVSLLGESADDVPIPRIITSCEGFNNDRRRISPLPDDDDNVNIEEKEREEVIEEKGSWLEEEKQEEEGSCLEEEEERSCLKEEKQEEVQEGSWLEEHKKEEEGSGLEEDKQEEGDDVADRQTGIPAEDLNHPHSHSPPLSDDYEVVEMDVDAEKKQEEEGQEIYGAASTSTLADNVRRTPQFAMVEYKSIGENDNTAKHGDYVPEFQEFVDLFKEVSEITEMDLVGKDLQDIIVSAMGTAMMEVPLSRLTSLQLGGNDITEVGIRAVAKAIKVGHLPALESLGLFPRRTANERYRFMRQEAAEWKHNLIRDDGVKALASAFDAGRASRLKVLTLEQNRFGQEGAEALASVIQAGHLRSLEILNVRDNNVGDEGIRLLANAFMEAGNNLRVLDLEGCNFYMEGTKALASALLSGRFSALTELYLGYNNRVLGPIWRGFWRAPWETQRLTPTDEGLMELAKVLQMGRLPKVQILDLENNTICSRKVAEAFRNAVRYNQSLVLTLKINWPSFAPYESSVRKYLDRNRRTAKIMVREEDVPATSGKVFLPGHPMEGKTTLRGSLQNNLPTSLLSMFTRRRQSDEPPTRGIEHDSPSLDTDYTEVVTLVVGNDRESKAHIAQALAKARGATKDELTKAGVRIFTKKSSPSAPVVIDTTALCTTKDWGRVDTARVWISQNGLRKLFGKHVFVVCVIASTDPNDEINKEPDFACNRFSWLHVLACILEKHIQQLVMLVNSEDSTDEASRRIPRLKEILKRDGFMGRDNITFFNLRTELTATIKYVLRHSDYRGEAEDETTTNRSVMPGPFLLRRVSWNHASDKDKFGPWSPENIILFGRTGSGKSTLAQMLTSRKLDAKHKTLSISSSIRGETRRVNVGHGRGWCVIDTPGFGESVDDEKSTLSTTKARELIKTHLQLVEGTYSHFFYVWKKARVDDLDVRLWKEFKRAFDAEMIKDHMTVVVSDAEPEWLNDPENNTHLKACFEGCESFVTANFPMSDDDDQDDCDAKKEVENLRLESLKELEGQITSLGRRDTSTAVGMWSKGTQRRNAQRSQAEPITMRPSIRQSPAFGPSAGPEHPHPSDYETARAYIRLKSWKSTIASMSK